MTELWQLYDKAGNALFGEGGTKAEIYAGALHGAAHVWIWRSEKGQTELLLQKRAADKRTWPDFWDISAAGHIDLGEEPLEAAVRETREEIGLDVNKVELVFISRRHDRLLAPSDAIENEFRWIYALKLESSTDFVLQKREVESLVWKPMDTVKAEVTSPQPGNLYVPQGQAYFDEVFSAIEKLAV